MQFSAIRHQPRSSILNFGISQNSSKSAILKRKCQPDLNSLHNMRPSGIPSAYFGADGDGAPAAARRGVASKSFQRRKSGKKPIESSPQEVNL